jgi:hypothetical protein
MLVEQAVMFRGFAAGWGGCRCWWCCFAHKIVVLGSLIGNP